MGRARWETVLTDVSIAAPGRSMAQRCGDCREMITEISAQASLATRTIEK
jgi:hypothetical protein